MKLAGRVSAAIEVVTEITARHRPAAEALHDWGKAHRFAGSTDRHAIGTLVYDTLRRRNSAAALMQSEAPRALVLGALHLVWQQSLAQIETLCAEQFGCGALTAEEKAALSQGPSNNTPAHVAGDFPQWLEPQLFKAFGPNLVAEMAALSQRAPIDLRVNTIKSVRDDVAKQLAKFNPKETPLSPFGLRIAAPAFDEKHANVEAEPAHGQGLFEVQDEASQLAAILSGASPGDKVLDLCAGAGGKTLALAALMQNEGRIIAYDRDRHRLRPIFERLPRSGATCVETVAADDFAALSKKGGFGLVVVDAPCTGSGTWRRKPDAKWRLRQKQLDLRLKEQREVLKQAADLVVSGGTLAYFTCSVLPAENTEQVAAFLKSYPDFALVPYTEVWRQKLSAPLASSADGATATLQLTPASHGTDGFFVALLRKK